METTRTAVVLALLALAAGPAARARAEDPWAAYRFLLGEWAGEGEGKPGKGAGRFSFVPDLQGKILVRRHRAEVTAPGGKPAVHEDLMVIHPGQGGGPAEADYFDNEGHVIRYTVAAGDGRLTFVSAAAPAAPRFRLTYVKEGAESVRVKFEIAPPGKPDGFQTYAEGVCRRVKGAERPDKEK
jgi:hypothetical protein